MTFIYHQLNLSHNNEFNHNIIQDTTLESLSQYPTSDSIEYSSSFKNNNTNINNEHIHKRNLHSFCNVLKIIYGTLYKDVICSIWTKLKFSIVCLFKTQYPSKMVLEWDLWGLFFNVSFLGINIHNIQEEYDYFNNNFTLSVFILIMIWVCIGSVLIYINLIISVMSYWSFFYILSMFGYSLYPFNIFLAVFNVLYSVMWIQRVGMIISVIWSCFIFWNFIRMPIPHDKRGIALYPVILILLFICMFILETISNGD